jgi:PAS domain S-box-containing protein
MPPHEEERYWLERDFVIDLLKQLPSRIFWKNKNSVYLGCNDVFAQSVGFSSPEEIIGKTDYDLPTTKEESASYQEDDKQVMQSLQPKLNIEESQTFPDGRKITLLTSKVPLLNKNGEVIGILGIYSDITDRKKMEEALHQAKIAAEAANQAKSVFIANMSHDIRTPLSGIIGVSKILERTGTSDEDREYGHTIHEASKDLLSLLNDILAVVSSDQVKEDSLNLETFSLPERIERMGRLFTANVQTKQIKLGINTDPNLPEYIVSDRLKIDRVLLNLISNALKFTERGYVKLSTHLQSNDHDHAIIQFIISDSGIGIPADKIDRIFDRFYKITPSYKTKHKGYGIGLFMVKQFVTLLGGKVAVESELGKGTAFHVTLPVKIGKKEEAKKVEDNAPQKVILAKSKVTTPPKPILSTKKKGNEFKVLLIEDDNLARRTGTFFLESTGLNPSLTIPPLGTPKFSQI